MRANYGCIETCTCKICMKNIVLNCAISNDSLRFIVKYKLNFKLKKVCWTYFNAKNGFQIKLIKKKKLQSLRHTRY